MVKEELGRGFLRIAKIFIKAGTIFLIIAIASACGPTSTAPANQGLGGAPESEQSGGGFNPGGQAQPAEEEGTPAFSRQDCPESSPAGALPDVQEAAIFPAGAWYANAEGSLWAATPRGGPAKGENTFAWVKPGGSALQVSGQRLDIMAPPMGVNLPPENGANYVTGVVSFPTDGCWQISAMAGSVSLGFIVYVAP